MHAMLPQVHASKTRLSKQLEPDSFPLNYQTAMRVIRDAVSAVKPAPVVVAEGANTMDQARCAPNRRCMQQGGVALLVRLFARQCNTC